MAVSAAFAVGSVALAGPVTWHPDGFVLRAQDFDRESGLGDVLNALTSLDTDARTSAGRSLSGRPESRSEQADSAGGSSMRPLSSEALGSISIFLDSIASETSRAGGRLSQRNRSVASGLRSMRLASGRGALRGPVLGLAATSVEEYVRNVRAGLDDPMIGGSTTTGRLLPLSTFANGGAVSNGFASAGSIRDDAGGRRSTRRSITRMLELPFDGDFETAASALAGSPTEAPDLPDTEREYRRAGDGWNVVPGGAGVGLAAFGLVSGRRRRR